MKDPKRIPLVLEALRKRWELDPHLRLTQLLWNVLAENDEWPYYQEDDDTLIRFRVTATRRQVRRP